MSKERSIDTLLLDGGCACFDFINTVSTRSDGDDPHEYLESYEKLLDWCKRVELLSDERLKRLADYVAQSGTEEIRQTMTEILETRGMLYRFFSSVSAGKQVVEQDLYAFNSRLSESLAKLKFKTNEEELYPDWEAGEPDLKEPLWRIMKSCFDVLIEGSFERIKECEACGWIFLDQSKNKSRRWCNMQTCGSAHKAKKYYHRKKKEEFE